MNKKLWRTILSYTFLSCLMAFEPCYAVEDDLSPDTLPDEIPTEQNFGHSFSEAETPRELQSDKGKPSEPQLQDPDAELEKPLIPLFPTEPVENNMDEPKNSTQAQIDEVLSTPDPSFTPPKVTLIPPPEISASAQNMSPLNQKNKTEEPNSPAIAPVAESKSVKADDTAQDLNFLSTTTKSAPAIRPNFVWAPKILQQMLADPLNLVPIDTYIARLAVPPTSPSRPPKGVSDFSIILSNNEFYPSKIVLKPGSTIRLLFTTTNKKSAALVIEKLNIQRWINSQFAGEKTKELDRTKFEVNRELSANRVTEITFQAKPGTYSFHDVITGASGEISVEEH